MISQMILFVLVVSPVLCVETPAQTESRSVATRPKERECVLRINSLLVRDHRLHLGYEISNNSKEEIWLCDDIDSDDPVDFETVASPDGLSLLVRLRLGIPMGWWRPQPPSGRYVRLTASGHYRASLWLALPVRQQPVLTSRSAHHIEESRQANRVVLEVGYFSGDLSARIVSLVQDANEAKRQWQVEEARIRKDEERLTQEHLEVVTRLKRVTDVEQRKQLQRKLDEIITQEDVWTWLNRTSFYAESLGLDISVALSDRLEEVNHGFGRNKHQLIIPYGYSQEVEHEHFLRVVTCDVNIPYLPPRYLDAAEMVPSGKDGVP